MLAMMLVMLGLAHADTAAQTGAPAETGAAISIEKDAPGIRFTARGANRDWHRARCSC